MGLCLCFHTWVDSFLLVRLSQSQALTQAANVSGPVAGSVALAVGGILGWAGGGRLTYSRSQIRAADCHVERRAFQSNSHRWFDPYQTSRGLLLGGLAMVAGVVLGLWAVLGGLTMIAAISLGYWARAVALRQ